MIKEKIENLPNTKKVTNVALFPAVMTAIFYTLYNTCTVQYIHTYMAHLLSSKTEKIGKNSDLNELHCRTFIASKTWLRIFIALEFLPTFFTVWLHIRVELLAFLASQYSFYGDTLHCKRLQCFSSLYKWWFIFALQSINNIYLVFGSRIFVKNNNIA